ncbi:hypothetical protein JOQ06_001206, partial [Pogonophryne albipinna]
MARHYSTQEALDIIMHSDCEDGSSSSSVDSEADTEEASESTEDASEVGTDQLESNSDSSETESGGELEEAAAGWTSKNGKVFWSPTNTETLRYVPAARSLIPGPTHYAVARISDPASSFALLMTDHIARARAILSSTFVYKDPLVSYIPRRGWNLLLLSTKHRSPDVSDEMKRKPFIIKDYNRCKGGVDNLDK